MINHARTLLLNIDGTNSPDLSYPGEEYVPSGFRARTIPPAIQPVYLALFPAGADRALRNLRLRQYLALLHRSELESYVLALDPRVTYLPLGSSLFDALLPVSQIRQLAGSTKTFYFYGVSPTPLAQGRIRFQYRVDVISSSTVRVRQYDERQQLLAEQTYAYTTTDGLSSLILLPDAGFSFRFETGVGSTWLVDAMARPARSLPGVISLLERVLSDTIADSLFGDAATTTEPYRTCRHLWEDHSQNLLRLAGVVLAMAYRLNEKGS